MGNVIVQPQKVVPGEPVLVQVCDSMGKPLADPSVTVSIQVCPGLGALLSVPDRRHPQAHRLCKPRSTERDHPSNRFGCWKGISIPSLAHSTDSDRGPNAPSRLGPGTTVCCDLHLGKHSGPRTSVCQVSLRKRCGPSNARSHGWGYGREAAIARQDIARSLSPRPRNRALGPLRSDPS
jgi:hypothetical protein